MMLFQSSTKTKFDAGQNKILTDEAMNLSYKAKGTHRVVSVLVVCAVPFYRLHSQLTETCFNGIFQNHIYEKAWTTYGEY